MDGRGVVFPFHGRPPRRPRTRLGRRQTSSMKERTEAPMKKPNQPPAEAVMNEPYVRTHYALERFIWVTNVVHDGCRAHEVALEVEGVEVHLYACPGSEKTGLNDLLSP